MNIEEYIIWSDESLVALNKPPGLRTIADGYQADLPHISALLQARFGQVWTIHRLDKDTSGIILFALTSDAHRSLSMQFQNRETQKEYHTIIIGYPDWETITLNLPLKIDGDRRHRTLVDHQAGKPAETDFKVLNRSGGFVLLSALPRTGYTHQIRAHLSTMGLPILGDPLYKSLKSETVLQQKARETAQSLPIHRLALHAHLITFRHPATGSITTLSAPYPPDFQDAVNLLFH